MLDLDLGTLFRLLLPVSGNVLLSRTIALTL